MTWGNCELTWCIKGKLKIIHEAIWRQFLSQVEYSMIKKKKSQPKNTAKEIQNSRLDWVLQFHPTLKKQTLSHLCGIHLTPICLTTKTSYVGDTMKNERHCWSQNTIVKIFRSVFNYRYQSKGKQMKKIRMSKKLIFLIWLGP